MRACYYQIRCLGKLRPYLTQSAANSIAVSLILSRLDYCNSVLYGLPSCQIKRLQHVQNTAARIVTRSKCRDHVTPLLKKLHWLPVSQRIDHKIMSLTYKCQNNTGPQYLQDVITPYRPTRALRSSTSSRLSIPGYGQNTDKKRSGARSFRNSAPKLWNDLPNVIKSAPSFKSFKRGLKTHLFQQL